MSPFHLAFPVHDLALARRFYGEMLGCPEGRSADEWVDFNFYGHQIVAHLAPAEAGLAQRNAVDGHGVPVRHFGIVLPMKDWEAMAERCRRGHRVSSSSRTSASRASRASRRRCSSSIRRATRSRSRHSPTSRAVREMIRRTSMFGKITLALAAAGSFSTAQNLAPPPLPPHPALPIPLLPPPSLSPPLSSPPPSPSSPLACPNQLDHDKEYGAR